MAPKTKFDRVKETVRLLKELQNHGISDSNDGYMQIKKCMDEWIYTGVKAEHEIHLRTYKRVAIITLPDTDSKAAEIVLKAI
jgi:hypothetical protein